MKPFFTFALLAAFAVILSACDTLKTQGAAIDRTVRKTQKAVTFTEGFGPVYISQRIDFNPK